MKMTFTNRNKKGFTLIELIVVIAILATLATIGGGAVLRYLETAKETPARETCMRIVQGATNFRNDHGVLPFRTSMAEPTEENNYQVSLVTADGKDADMLAILTNNETVDDEERMNTTRDTYFPADEQEKKMDGMYRDPNTDALSLYDPWGKPYYVMMCEESEGCTDPFTGKQLRGKNCIAYCLGANGTGIAPEATPARGKKTKPKGNKKPAEASIEEEEMQEAIADNIYSWKKSAK